MRIVCDSSTLILLEKTKLLDMILRNNEVIIPKEVYKEAVSKGKKGKHPDSYEIERKINKGIIKVVEIKDKREFKEIRKNFNLAKGETEAIILLHEVKGDVVALDDLKAMKYCVYNKIPQLVKGLVQAIMTQSEQGYHFEGEEFNIKVSNENLIQIHGDLVGKDTDFEFKLEQEYLSFISSAVLSSISF